MSPMAHIRLDVPTLRRVFSGNIQEHKTSKDWQVDMGTGT